MGDESKIITIIRHGETEWNRIGRQQGHLDSPLSEEGIKQAEMLANYLENKGYEVLYSSSLGRAVQTAEIINKKLKLKHIKDDALRERHLGIIQGSTIEEFENNYPDEYEKFRSNDPEYVIPDGESINQRYARTIDCMNKIARRTDFKKYLIVTHGGNLESIFKYVLGIPLDKKRNFSIFNSSLNNFEYDSGKWTMLTWGDISPLEGFVVLDDF